MSLGYLLSLSEQLQADLARLAGKTGERPSLGMSGEVRLQPERRHEFLGDLRAAIQGVLAKHGGADGVAFKVALACYPKEDLTDDDHADLHAPGAHRRRARSRLRGADRRGRAPGLAGRAR